MFIQRTTPALRQAVQARSINLQSLVGRRLQSTVGGQTAEKGKAKLVSGVCTYAHGNTLMASVFTGVPVWAQGCAYRALAHGRGRRCRHYRRRICDFASL